MMGLGKGGLPLNMAIILVSYMGVSQNKGKTPKMDGENKGKPY